MAAVGAGRDAGLTDTPACPLDLFLHGDAEMDPCLFASLPNGERS